MAHLSEDGVFGNQHETVASNVLCYILNKRVAARAAVQQIASEIAGIALLPDLRYKHQSTDEDMTRPDIVGQDAAGNAPLMIETKFYSALTDNQPTTYVTDLFAGGVLLFVCPTVCLTSIAQKLEQRLSARAAWRDNDAVMHLPDTNKHVVVLGWEKVFDILEQKLTEEGAYDFRQLRDFYDEDIGRTTVTQILQENLTREHAAALLSYWGRYEVKTVRGAMENERESQKEYKEVHNYETMIERIYDALERRSVLQRLYFKAAYDSSGYLHYGQIQKNALDPVAMELRVDFEMWACAMNEREQTPFWVGFFLDGDADLSKAKYLYDRSLSVAKTRGDDNPLTVDEINQIKYFPITLDQKTRIECRRVDCIRRR